MIIGVPREIKDNEKRVALTPAGAHTLVDDGHAVRVEAGAGAGSGFSDEEYREAGAEIVGTAAEAWATALVLKVKEPLASEYELMHEDQILFTFLHLAADRELTLQLVQRRVTAIAYETVQTADGHLPILMPMSEVAGRMAPQVGAQALLHMDGGRGVLMGGVPGVHPARVVVLGSGTVGSNAARVALGMGAQVTVFSASLPQLRDLDIAFGGRMVTMAANARDIAQAVQSADLVIGAVLVPGAKAPKLVNEETVKRMLPGSVIVDVAVDQGGSVETIRPTSHSEPTFIKHGVVHYAVPNMPGAVPRTSTMALCNVTLPYVRRLAELGFERAVRESAELAPGVNTWAGVVTHQAVAEAHNLDYVPLEAMFSGRAESRSA